MNDRTDNNRVEYANMSAQTRSSVPDLRLLDALFHAGVQTLKFEEGKRGALRAIVMRDGKRVVGPEAASRDEAITAVMRNIRGGAPAGAGAMSDEDWRRHVRLRIAQAEL
jgi:hypothetical protein